MRSSGCIFLRLRWQGLPRGGAYTFTEIIASQLATRENPKLDLDHEDLLVNRDTMDSCALTVLDLIAGYDGITPRGAPDEKIVLTSAPVNLVLERHRERLQEIRIAWLERVCRLDESPLLVKAARRLLVKIIPEEERIEALDSTIRNFLKTLQDRL